MLAQLIIGSTLILATIVVSGLTWWGLEAILVRLHTWASRPPHGPKLTAVLTLSLICTLMMMTVSVWVWAIALFWLEIFITFEASMYFALVAFTTLGFGDILLPQEWRLLSGLAAANGLLIFGMLTAMLVEALRNTRRRQRDRRAK